MASARYRPTFILLLTATLGLAQPLRQPRPEAVAAAPLVVSPKDRITSNIDDAFTATLPGHVVRGAQPDNDRGPVPDNLPMARMILSMTRDADQQAALDAFSVGLQDPHSPLYHQWLTSETFGARFGLSQNDLSRVTSWLKSMGFTVDDVPAGNWTITFSGTAGQVASAFHTAIRYYTIDGEIRYANSDDPQIPRALAGVVAAIVGLHNIPPVPVHRLTVPDGGGGTFHYLNPSDFAAIYNLNPLYSSGIKGSGVKIAVIEECTMDVSLASTFWTIEGVAQSSNLYQNYGTPAPCTQTFNDEVYLDYEWSGALAPDAQIWLVSSNTSNSLLGAVQGVVTNSFAPVVTVSYSDCESAYDQVWANLWQQAATEGITGLVSSGDTGAAGCDSRNANAASHGLSVNGICSSAWVVCVGGTQFNDVASPAQYWSTAGKASGYIPEIAWNEEAGGSTIFGSTGGGYSTFQAKPAWQTGNTTTQRGVPDVALSSAAHDGYRICEGSTPCTVNASTVWVEDGTSASAPAFAAIMALLVQATGQWQGSPNQTLYGLAGQPSLGIFHDIVSGSNSVNGLQGFSTASGWDAVTGLGSVNAAALIGSWPGATTGIPVLTNLELTKAAPASGCAVPLAASSFLTTDSTIYLYFSAAVAASDHLSNDWLAPNGDVVTGAAWGAVAGTFCFSDSALNVAALPSLHLGAWQARIYDNGTQIGSVSFIVSKTVVVPAITNLSPTSVIAGKNGVTLTVNGSGFVSGAAIRWNGSAITTTFVSATQLLGTVPSGLLGSPGTVSITVLSGGQVSAASGFAITPALITLSRAGVLAQVAAGGGWDTETYLTNSTAAAISIELLFHADNGSALVLPLIATQQGTTQTIPTSTLVATIPADTTLAVDTGSLAVTAQGWAEVLSTGPLTGFAVFRYAPQGLSGGPGITTPWEGTVPLQTLFTATTVIVPFDNTGAFATGVALGNLNSADISVSAAFFDDNGNPVASPQTISVPGGGHTAFLVNSQFAFTANTKGLMKITGPSGLLAVGLRSSPYGTLTSVPVPVQ